MIEFARKHVEELAKSVFEPIWAWVLARSWPGRASLLALFSALLAVAYWPDAARERFGTARHVAAVMLAPDTRMPLDAELLVESGQRLARLSRAVRNDLGAVPAAGTNPWVVAEQLVGLGMTGQRGADTRPFVAYIRTNQRPECFCWNQFPKVGGEIGVFISGWVLTAFADLGEPLSVTELDSVLALQDRKGWWPMYAQPRDPRFASTYSTAWLVFGLVRQQRAGLVPQERREAVAAAIEAGTTWLVAARLPGSRWRLYPNKLDSRVSDSASGFVLHSLTAARVKDLQPLYREWLANLPSPAAIEAKPDETSYEELIGSEHTSVDTIVQMTVPWTLAATVDAFSYGSTEEKAKAVQWVDTILDGKFVTKVDGDVFDWWRSELLYALAYFHSHPVIDDGAARAAAPRP